MPTKGVELIVKMLNTFGKQGVLELVKKVCQSVSVNVNGVPERANGPIVSFGIR